MHTQTIRIVMADDHKMMVSALAEMLQQNEGIKVLEIFPDGNKLLQYLSSDAEYVDLILLDIHMAELDGLAVLPIIKSRFPQIKIIVLSMYYTPQLLNQVKDKGADSFIHKADEPEVLLQRIYEVMEGKKIFPVYHPVNTSFTNEITEDVYMKISVLTEREKQIARQIKDGFTSPEIAAILFLSEYTIDTYRKNILKKLGLKSTSELVRFALENRL